MAKVWIGTSGFSYPHWGKGVFYPKDIPQTKWFEYYCQHFKTVELNVSFYRLPKKETFKGWRKRAGKDFVFSVKGSRYITHIKRLKDCREPIKTFFKNANEIKEKNDVVLWQLPPRFKANLERLDQFLKLLPKNWRHAFEFRNKSWLAGEVYKILKKHKPDKAWIEKLYTFPIKRGGRILSRQNQMYATYWHIVVKAISEMNVPYEELDTRRLAKKGMARTLAKEWIKKKRYSDHEAECVAWFLYIMKAKL